MSKALIIKGVNYSANSFDVVHFEGSDAKPCTGITLSESTLNMHNADTRTLTANVTPADTTDAITWTSSDPTVVSVVNGLVTALGIGAATITATCGNYSATCAVSVSYIVTGSVQTAGKRLAGAPISTGNGTIYYENHAAYGAVASDEGTLSLYNQPETFPIPIPSNARKIRVTVPSEVTIYRIAMVDATQSPPTASGSCTLLAFVTGSEMTAVSPGVYEYTLQNYVGYSLTALVFCFGKSSFADADFEGIEIEFLGS